MLVKYNGASLYKCCGMRLMPGTNDVSKDVWERAKKHPAIKSRIKDGKIVFNGAKPSDSEDLGPFEGKNAKDSIEVVEGTLDREVLKKWKDEETRVTVLKAIDAQIEKLTAPKDGE